MRPAARPLLLALVPLVLLSGCFQLRALLRVGDDGSGTLEETVLLGGMLREMMASRDSGAAVALYDLDSLRAHAARLGPGVRLLRVDSVEEGDAFGYRAVYAVADVAALRFRFNPHPLPGQGGRNPAPGGDGPMLAGTAESLPVTFGWDAAGRVLRVRMPQPAPAARPAPPDRAAVAALTDSLRRQMAASGPMARQMLDEVRIAFAVRGPGRVAASDAAVASDSTVTLFDLPLGAFVGLAEEKPELVARAQLLQRAGTPDPRPVLRALAARLGVQYELRPEVTVRFER